MFNTIRQTLADLPLSDIEKDKMAGKLMVRLIEDGYWKIDMKKVEELFECVRIVEERIFKAKK